MSKVEIERITGNKKELVLDTVIEEYPLTIYVNDKELVTLMCSPANLDYLALGFLQSEGFIQDRSSIEHIEVDKENGYINVRIKDGENIVAQKLSGKKVFTTGCGKGTTFLDVVDCLVTNPVKASLSISTRKVFEFVDELSKRSRLFTKTGAAHISLLASTESVLFAHEDLGRHNALDKLFGECLMRGINFDDKIIVTSGRISSEMLIKCARRKIPLLISRSAATSLAVELARKAGITLIGFVRGERMNIYANGWRTIHDYE